MNIDPKTGLDLDDPDVKAMLAQQARDDATHGVPSPLPALPASPLFAMGDEPRGKPAGLPPAVLPVTRVPPLPPEQAALPPPVEPPPPAVPPPPSAPTPVKAPSAVARPTPTDPTGKLTQGEQAARAMQGSVEQDQLATIEKGQTLGHDKAEAVAAQDALDAADYAKFQQDTQKRLSAAGQHLERVKAERSKMDVRQMFEGKPGAAIVAALATGIGAYASSLTGGPNQAMQVINAAVAAHRQQQLDRIDLKSMDVNEAKDAVHNAQLEIAAQEAGMFKKFAMERAKRLSVFGADAATIENDKLRNELLAKGADREMAVQSGLEQRGRDILKEGAQRKLIASEVSKNYAEVGKIGAETDAKRAETAAGGKDSGGRAAGIQIQKAQLAEHGAAALQTIDELQGKGLRLSKKDWARIQENDKDLKAQEHAGLIEGKLGRATGAVARSRYEGLTPSKQRLAQAYDILSQKAAAIASPSHAAEEIDHARQLFAIGPSDEEDIQRQKLEQARGVIGAAKGLGGKYTEIAATGAMKERGLAPQSDKVNQVKEWLQSPEARKNPGKAAKYSQYLRELGAL